MLLETSDKEENKTTVFFFKENNFQTAKEITKVFKRELKTQMR